MLQAYDCSCLGSLLETKSHNCPSCLSLSVRGLVQKYMYGNKKYVISIGFSIW
jgi:hypothetical protein